MDVKTIAYISQRKDLIKINKTMLFNPLNLSKNKKYIIGAAKNDANYTMILWWRAICSYYAFPPRPSRDLLFLTQYVDTRCSLSA